MKWNRLSCLISLVFLAIISVAVGWDREKGSGLSDKVASTGLLGRLWTDAKTSGRKTGTEGKKGRVVVNSGGTTRSSGLHDFVIDMIRNFPSCILNSLLVCSRLDGNICSYVFES